ncbi:MAG: 30S ribosomal protein S2 [Candidatus Onthovivens sp.]|nr:30S ribosomal protein S2 [Candidatus Onthovivens sp.]
MAEETKVETVEVAAAETNVMDTIVHDENASVVTLKKLLEAGVHYGHPTKKWNPKMGKYIYCPRNGIYIIDLNKTKDALTDAYKKLESIVLEGGKVLIVGTKDNAKEIVEAEALRSGSFYITNRWLGGILTNFKTIQTRIRKLKDLESAEDDGSWDRLPKKEAIALRKEKEKLAKNLEGIKEMRKLPNAIIVIDPTEEVNACKEARKLNIPVFAICDTNCDPDGIDYVIPGNDDATKSISMILGILNDAVVEAKGGLPQIAYSKDEGEEVTMKDAIRQADRENALRLAARREMQREKMEREKQKREAFLARQNAAQKEQSVENKAPKAEKAAQ